MIFHMWFRVLAALVTVITIACSSPQPEQEVRLLLAGQAVEVPEYDFTVHRDGDDVYGFVAAVYRTDHPTLPEADA